MYTMENLSVIHHEEPLHSFSAIKIEPNTDFWNPPLLQPTSVITENLPTYTSLEPVYPETSSFAPSTTQYFPLTNSSSIQPLYSSSLHDNNDLSLLHSTLYRDPDLNQTARDEGLGSSPSSFSSTTPPLPQGQPIVLGQLVTSSKSNYESQRSTSSTPESTVSNYSTALECSNCGNRCDIFWVNTHYLCRQCFPERPPVTQQAPSEESIGAKRKRTTAATKHVNQICTNCEATFSKLWRRSISSGNTVCNACGLYEKLHNVPRPKHMRKDTIQSRKRKPKASESAKGKNSSRKNSKKSQLVSQTAQQQQYIPNDVQHYTLPNYNTLQVRDLSSSANNTHRTAMLPPMNSNQSFYAQYRPELNNIFNSVPPNEVINISHSMSLSNMPFTNS